MKIESAELRVVQVALARPFETSFGVSRREEKLLVRLRCDGVEGWGECPASAFPGYSSETAWTALHVAERFLLPPVVGREIATADELRASFRAVRGHPMAKAGIEFAFWDALGRAQGRSLRSLLSGTRDRVDAGISLGLERTDEEIAERVAAAFARGYHRVKLKIKPGRDVEMVAFVRGRFPEAKLMVDANAAYGLSDSPRLALLDTLGLTMIEQPLAEGDLLDHAELARRIRTPICLDESIPSAAAARQAIEIGACRIVNVKAARVGGLVEAVAVHDAARERSVPVWCGGLLETGIGRAVNVALASLPGFTLPGDLSETARYWDESEELFDPPFVLSADGTLEVPAGPGAGVAPVPDRLERASLATVQVRSTA